MCCVRMLRFLATTIGVGRMLYKTVCGSESIRRLSCEVSAAALYHRRSRNASNFFLSHLPRVSFRMRPLRHKLGWHETGWLAAFV